VKPVPEIAAEFTVTGEVPVEVRTKACVVWLFTVTLPKLRLLALTVNCGFAAAVPVPLRATTDVPPLVELLLIEICPVAAPVAVGSNRTCRVTDWIGLSVIGKLPLTMVKLAPEVAAEFTVTGEVPVEVRVKACVVAVLTVTLPKVRLAVPRVNCGFAGAVPVPLKATTAELPLLELLLTEICPVVAPVAVGSNCTCRITDWVGLRVIGKLPPTTVKPVPEIAAEFTVTGEVPVEVRTKAWLVAVLTVTLPKLRLVALRANCGFAAAVPVPLRATTAVPPLVELSLTEICPAAAPVVVGSNCTCRVTAWVGLRVIGKLPPTMVKPVPEIVAEFTVTGAVPIEIRVKGCVVAVFTDTLPKLRLDALTFNCGLACGLDAAVPVPLRATTTVVLLDELLLTEICPVAAPAAVGSNCTCRLTAWLGLRVIGKLPLTMVKPAPEIAAEFTVTGEVPVEVRVKGCVVAVFTVSLPKLRLLALTVNCGFEVFAPRPCITICAIGFADASITVNCPE
jgi:hypothetical protein